MSTKPGQLQTPASVLRGPRRVGKTVLLRQLIESLIAAGVNPQRILYIAFDELPTLRDLDEPVLAIARWYEREVLATTFNAAAHEGRPAFLFFDEVQNLDAWACTVTAGNAGCSPESAAGSW